MRITLVGVGFIGRAWAIAFARAGHEVKLWSRSRETAEQAVDYVATMLPVLEEKGLLDGRSVGEVLANLQIESDLGNALRCAEYVQESTAESLELKKAVFAELDELAPREAILASSTSALLPSHFTADLPGRERCMVVHPINPPYLVPAAEVVPAPWTSSQLVECVRSFLISMGQVPIVMKREIDGFVMNRLQGALLDEAFRLVSEGYAKTDDVDTGVRDGLGLRWSFMGPFETCDLNSPDGIEEFVQRYEPLYANLFSQRQERISWTGPVLEDVTEDRRALLPATDLRQRQMWRDERLAALVAHKRVMALEAEG